MRYVPPFARIRDHLRISQTKGGAARVTTTFEELVRLIQELLAGLEIDEAWYLEQNEDVAQSIQAGTIQSAKQHFLDHGYFEGRAPFHMAVDETWYLAMNEDVAEQVRLGTFESGQAHFNTSGYHEGRRPRPT